MKPLLFASGLLALGAVGGAGYAFVPALLSPFATATAAAPPAQPVAPPAAAPLASTDMSAPLVTGSIATASATPAHQPGAGPRKGMTYRSFNVDQPYIALTFDDGPSPETTPQLLSILKARGIKATFFVLGNMAAKHPEVLKMIADDGHEIGNHSWSHPQLTRIPLAAADKQVGETSALVEEVTGHKPRYLRPPYGSMKPALRDHLEDAFGVTIVNWSVDPLDWKHRDAKVVHDEIMKQVKPGAIVLSHDIYPSTVAAMEQVLDELIAKGYKFGTISDLIAMDKAPLTPKVATLGPKPAKEQKKQAQKPQQKPAKPQAAASNGTRPASGSNRSTSAQGGVY
ncbi:polysaccharide deacetylase family protein [Xanthobacter variabilis]|uniref:polysaccharide deacetylase family protein n=1 Tax=Xanthobacter variabilis TaxID=3119932 RepID=UPI00374F7CC3